jgi:hypothetical protein
MKNLLLTSILLLSFLFSFSQSEKKYTVNEAVFDNINVYLLNYNGSNIKIDIDFFTEKHLFFRITQNNILYKIPFSKIDSTKELLNILSTKNSIEFYTNGMALNQFSSQSQLGMVLQLFAPLLLLIPNDRGNYYGLYATLGVSLVATFIHIDAFRHLKTFALIESAIEYPY